MREPRTPASDGGVYAGWCVYVVGVCTSYAAAPTVGVKFRHCTVRVQHLTEYVQAGRRWSPAHCLCPITRSKLATKAGLGWAGLGGTPLPPIIPSFSVRRQHSLPFCIRMYSAREGRVGSSSPHTHTHAVAPVRTYRDTIMAYHARCNVGLPRPPSAGLPRLYE